MAFSLFSPVTVGMHLTANDTFLTLREMHYLLSGTEAAVQDPLEDQLTVTRELSQ